MVNEGKSSSRTLNSNRMTAVNNSNDDDDIFGDVSDSEEGGGLRVGEEYQAKVEDTVLPGPAPPDYDEKAFMVWKPNDQLEDFKLYDYVTLASEKYGYSKEQALSLLYWHNFDFQKAQPQLAVHFPHPEAQSWSKHDETAFRFFLVENEKNFTRLKLVLAEKSMRSLVRHYYCFKHRPTFTANSSINADRTSLYSEDEPVDLNRNITNSFGTNDPLIPALPHLRCTVCGESNKISYNTTKGLVCHVCFLAGCRNGTISSSSKSNPWSLRALKDLNDECISDPSIKKVFTDPRIVSIINEFNLNTPTDVLRNLDNEIETGIQNIRNMKRTIEDKKKALEELGELPDIPPVQPRMISRWTSEEISIFFQAVAEYGRDFKVIAEIMGSKNENTLRAFNTANGGRYYVKDIADEYYEANPFAIQKHGAN